MTQRTTSSSWARGIVDALEIEGLDTRQLFAELGLDYEALDDPEARFPQDDMTRLWHRALALSGNPAIGLNMARGVRPTSFHVVGYALMTSRTLRDGIGRLVRFQRIIAEGADLSLRPEPDGYVLSLAIHGDRLPPATPSLEASLAYLLTFCRWVAGTGVMPVETRFRGPAPANLVPYQEVFGDTLRFGCAEYALVFSRSVMERSLPTANEELARLHDRFAGEYLARFSGSRVSHSARQVICRLLPQGEPKREVVAQALLLSQRTLQRRLQEEGTSFQALLEDTRRELALQYLAQPDRSLLEVAYLLGFSDPSNFFRAFRRWFGTTPGEYRNRLQ